MEKRAVYIIKQKCGVLHPRSDANRFRVSESFHYDLNYITIDNIFISTLF